MSKYSSTYLSHDICYLLFALDELWRERTPGKITLANYQENISGLGAILGKKKLNLLIKH
jgi:hypothetical protein